MDAISAIDPAERGDTQRELGARTGISQSTISRMNKREYLYPTTGCYVPFLTHKHKRQRVEWTLDQPAVIPEQLIVAL